MQNAATHCNTLQHTATHCNTLQHTATHCSTQTLRIAYSRCCSTTHCNTLQHTATHCTILHHTATHTLQQTATHCTTLQHIATHCNAQILRIASSRHSSATHCNTLQHTAKRRLFESLPVDVEVKHVQHTATHSNTRQRNRCCKIWRSPSERGSSHPSPSSFSPHPLRPPHFASGANKRTLGRPKVNEWAGPRLMN